MLEQCKQRVRKAGFTVTEVLLASSIMSLLAAGCLTLYIMFQRAWRAAQVHMEADRQATLAVSRMLYGMGGRKGLRSAGHNSLALQSLAGGWNLTYVSYGNQTNRVEFRSAPGTLELQPGALQLATNVADASVSQAVDRVFIRVRVGITEGRFTATNEVQTAVRLRN